MHTDVAVIFSQAIEGFARTYDAQLTPKLRNEMKELGIDLDRLLPAYPLDVFERVMRHTGAAIYPEMEEAERWRRMGREFIEGWVQTTVGKALQVMARLIGPHRFFARIARTFRAGSNYLDAEATKLGPTEIDLRVWMLQPYLAEWSGKPLLHLDYRLGLLEGAMAGFEVKEFSVTMIEKDFVTQSGRYRIRWKA